MDSISFIQPDDFHVHFRDGAILARVVPFTATDFGRAIVMPNLAGNEQARLLATLRRDSNTENTRAIQTAS
jgi:dihydroorotase